MKKITNPVSTNDCNFRAVRVTAVTAAVLAASLGALLPGTARAQTYIGNAYTTKAGASSFLGANALATVVNNLGANATVFDTGFLNATNKQSLNALGANASVGLNLASSSVLGALGVGNLVNANATTSQTTSVFTPINPSDTAVQSTARVVGLQMGSSTAVIPNVSATILNSLVQASVVQSQTTAAASGVATGQTVLTNFSLNGLTAAQLGVVGSLDANGNLTVTQQQTVAVYDSFLLGSVGTGTQIGTLTINELLPNSVAQGALTTNALHLKLNSNLGLLNTALGSVAGADVVVSSSTAGLNVAAPEPGSLALLAAGLVPVLGLVRRRRRAQTEIISL